MRDIPNAKRLQLGLIFQAEVRQGQGVLCVETRARIRTSLYVDQEDIYTPVELLEFCLHLRGCTVAGPSPACVKINHSLLAI
jgi:hypothetical protein